MATNDDFAPHPLESLIPGIGRDLREKQERHQVVLNSAGYLAQRERLAKLTKAFLHALQVTCLAATRHENLSKNSFFLSQIDQIAESAISISTSLEQGMRNPARRELRFALDTAVIALHVDQQMPKSVLAARIAFFNHKVDKSSIAPVNTLALEMLAEERDAFATDVKRAYGRASEYVHPSMQQLIESNDLRAAGITLGFDTEKELSEALDEAFEVYSLILVLAFHTIGPSFTGDLLVDGVDGLDAWPFHAHQYLAKIDSYFDYKAERAARLAEIQARRERRLHG